MYINPIKIYRPNLNLIFSHLSYIIRLLFPFKSPIKLDTLIFGGISTNICIGLDILLHLLYLLPSIYIIFSIFDLFLICYYYKILFFYTLVRILYGIYNSMLYVIKYDCYPLTWPPFVFLFTDRTISV